MAEPRTRAERVDALLPGLLHWSIVDERIDGFRSDAYAVRTDGGVLLIDALPLAPHLQEDLGPIAGVFLTHGNHQRSAWRLRRETGAPVYAPAGARGLDEEPDVRFDEGTTLPGGLRAIEAGAFDAACALIAGSVESGGADRSSDGVVAFCGDLVCQDPGGPLRFPVQPGYFDTQRGAEDARRLLDAAPTVLCAAHAEPLLEGVGEVLRRLAGREV